MHSCLKSSSDSAGIVSGRGDMLTSVLVGCEAEALPGITEGEATLALALEADF